jgi:hypothetical protein
MNAKKVTYAGRRAGRIPWYGTNRVFHPATVMRRAAKKTTRDPFQTFLFPDFLPGKSF